MQQAAIPVTPNLFAWFMFAAWIPLSIAFFAVLKPHTALLLTFVGGLLLLPERVGVNPPILTTLTKNDLVSVMAFIGCLWKRPKQLVKSRPFQGIELLFFVLFACAFGMALTNMDPIVVGVSAFPGTAIMDGVSLGLADVTLVMLPFFIGRAMFRSPAELKEFMYGIAAAAVGHSMLCWWEMRMSPQLHRTFYGFFQHEFQQTIRLGGYRPMVFMAHGLAVAQFMLTGANIGMAIMKVKGKLGRIKGKYLGPYLVIAMVFIKSAGAIVFSMVSLPLIMLTSPRLQTRFATVVAIVFLAYPVVKLAGAFPADTMVEVAKTFSEDRARSLKARMDNDELLMSKARERLLFGWGPFGRSRVVDSRGVDAAPPDGYWVMQLGERGVIRLGCLFALLVYPVFAARKVLRKLRDKKEQIMIAALSLTVIFFALDLLPNNCYNPMPYFYAGALLGLTQGLPKAAKKEAKQRQTMMAQAYGPMQRAG